MHTPLTFAEAVRLTLDEGAPLTEALLAARNGRTRDEARAALTPKGKARASRGKKVSAEAQPPR